MAAPAVCPECDGSGWRLYRVETVEGEEEWAWELCPECGGGDAFPPKEGRVGWAPSIPRSSCAITSPVAATGPPQHACPNGERILDRLSRRFVFRVALPRSVHLQARARHGDNPGAARA
jgi:hypothetical protein